MKLVSRNLIRLGLLIVSFIVSFWNILFTRRSRNRIIDENKSTVSWNKQGRSEVQNVNLDLSFTSSNTANHFNNSTRNDFNMLNESKPSALSPDEERRRSSENPRIEAFKNPRYQPTQGHTIDIISIGSITRSDYQLAQQNTMGQHHAVRYYFPITEKHDSESDCHSNFTGTHVKSILEYCGTTKSKSNEALEQFKSLYIIEKYLKRKKNPLGWMCAQKRLGDGFHLVSKFYSTLNESLPDHLTIIDDDTYYNFDALLAHKEWPAPSVPMVLAGCLFRHRYMKSFTFNFPFGGFGITLTQAALENFLRPVNCNFTNTSKEEEDHICDTIEKNYAGERPFFQNGMSLSDLMHRYTSEQRYLEVEQWDGPGFCFHSDWTLPFFIKFYGEPVSPQMLRAFDQSFVLIGKRRDGRLRGQCLNLRDDSCGAESTMCHYISPGRMIELYRNTSMGRF